MDWALPDYLSIRCQHVTLQRSRYLGRQNQYNRIHISLIRLEQLNFGSDWMKFKIGDGIKAQNSYGVLANELSLSTSV